MQFNRFISFLSKFNLGGGPACARPSKAAMHQQSGWLYMARCQHSRTFHTIGNAGGYWATRISHVTPLKRQQ